MPSTTTPSGLSIPWRTSSPSRASRTAPFSLNLTSELIDEVIEAALNHVAQASRGRTVTVEHTDDILLVRIDVHLIMQVLTNLIMNAFKYTPEDSTVTVSARREGAFVVVDVADVGRACRTATSPSYL